MIFGNNNNYYGALDELNTDEHFNALEPANYDEKGDPITPDDAVNFTTKEIGVTTKPFGNTLDSLKEKIRDGAGRIEFSFLRGGKGSSEAPNPESFGTAERTDIRELLKVNEMKTSTHAPVHAESLAGFDNQRGFDNFRRSNALKEIKRAIDFAGEATKGGAVVFHLHEWQRPLSEIKDGDAKFKMYDEEDKETPLFAVDNRDGRLIENISRNRVVFRPKYETAGSMGIAGKTDSKGNVLKENDWVDIDGNLIPKNADAETLFNRVPVFNKEKTNFETEELNWDKLDKITKEYNEGRSPDDQIQPEEMFAKIQFENKILQAKGSSIYHARQYELEKKQVAKYKDLIDKYNTLKESLSEDRKFQADAWLATKMGDKDVSIEDIKMQYDLHKNGLRHIHESSSSADVQARDLAETYKNITSLKKHGLDKTADTIAKAGLYAMEVYKRNKNKYGLEDPIYVAPENWDVKMYGSHPKEYREAIEKSRKKMIQMLQSRNHSKEEAEKLAKEHIKGTLDIGHMNMYRYHFQPKDENESAEETDKRFNKWMLDEAEKLVKDGIVGHIHLSDNFGYDDEHLTPGQGNIPMKEFLKRMEKHGINDLIIETGSFNPKTALPDTLAHIGSPVFGVNRRIRHNGIRDRHFGYNAPGFFIAGSYVPSNEWKFWSDVPLE
ncbi:MAG: TIM barrel protein [Candidatus Woesearchaeota archaeon]